jgi:hypothetical protein
MAKHSIQFPNWINDTYSLDEAQQKEQQLFQQKGANDDGIVTTFGKSLLKGASSLTPNNIAIDILDTLGVDTSSNPLAQRQREGNTELEELTKVNRQDVETPFKPGWIASNVGEMIPGSLALGKVAGLIKGSSAAGKVFDTAERYFLGKGMSPEKAAKMADLAVNASIGTTAAVPEAGLEGIQNYKQVLNETGDQSQAIGAGIKTGLANLPLLIAGDTAELAFGTKGLGKNAKTPNLFSSMFKAGATEAPEEAGQSIISDYFGNRPISTDAAIQSGFLGAIGGGLHAVGANALTNIQSKVDSIKLDNAKKSFDAEVQSIKESNPQVAQFLDTNFGSNRIVVPARQLLQNLKTMEANGTLSEEHGVLMNNLESALEGRKVLGMLHCIAW